ncbi:ABC transporter substrate-binding protein [Variovorax ginsengisoli]|uniref:ABC transporter substrate-binding protein n=1 Tax=Variovorax ginsengisoli TaxID=363844 RepID=A0ABT8SGA7_9BURK|nr:ABC transporter substrate-binding protein [Variovorax ginsengisoli]MDN8618595.1 ABC transporter substrate-binding protein [Variovorax ginsengisoli]MDO1537765.1 ABC transporter substrate-binding protein [Variovorax ginsengisoli]
MSRLIRRPAHSCAWALAFTTLSSAASAAEPIKIGLVAILSGPSALSGEAITRGLQTAIDEVNAKGGLLGGRKLELVRRDDESNPTKGVTAARELIYKEKVAVLFGGADTPVAMAIVPLANKEAVPFMVPWAAGTPITHNGAATNYVFRVSAVDEVVDKALVQYAQKTFKSTKPGLMLVNNPWGESNEKGLKATLAEKGASAAGAEKFEDADLDMVPQLTRLKNAGADSIIMAAPTSSGAQIVKSLDRMGWKVPVVSHWGIAGGRFTELAGPNAKDVHFVQTYSFFGKQSPVGERVTKAIMAKYPGVKGPADITPASGVANAYDAMQLTALAIAQAGSTNGDAIRQGFHKIPSYEGLIKNYTQPFGGNSQDALSADDYVWAHFVDNRVLPVGMDN